MNVISDAATWDLRAGKSIRLGRRQHRENVRAGKTGPLQFFWGDFPNVGNLVSDTPSVQHHLCFGDRSEDVGGAIDWRPSAAGVGGNDLQEQEARDWTKSRSE